MRGLTEKQYFRRNGNAVDHNAVRQREFPAVPHQIDRFHGLCIRPENRGFIGGFLRSIVPHGNRTVPAARKLQYPEIRSLIDAAAELHCPEDRSKRIINHIDRFRIEIKCHKAVMMFRIVGGKTVVAQIIPVVADCARRPGVEKFLKQRLRLSPLPETIRGHRCFVGKPWHVNAGALPHRQQEFLHMPTIRFKPAVTMKRVNIKILFPVHKHILLKPVLIVLRVRMSKTAGQDLHMRSKFSLLLTDDLLQLYIIRRGKIAEGEQIRFVPDLPETDTVAIIPEEESDIVAPFPEIRQTVRFVFD